MTPPRNSDESNGKSGRRDELLEIAAGLFADRGVRATTVRDIADAAGILSGSLYHHFASKEEIADEILTAFLDAVLARYDEILAAGLPPREAFEALVTASLQALERDRAAIVIYQDDGRHLEGLERFGYLADADRRFDQAWTSVLQDGVDSGAFRGGVDPAQASRFVRATLWAGARAYRPDGDLAPQAIAAEYAAIVLDGIAKPAKKKGGKKGGKKG